ncbi:PREDICTED: uncharacterized protein LOC106102358 isoform X2 [Papilio polytes]|uniref:uncharacterized protein LOC106102358 isoform X2 n=1 Tax=Papilio polytes TaxID=76194 RepID=UPI0006762833|nr:PREDICTED: uncharacterized protein LOC106102358 isoform X2 [Papilio polytes]
MDEDKKQASHPSTSKIEDRSNNSRQDVRGEEQDVQSNSFVSESSVYTDNSFITTANEAKEITKINRIMKEISDQKKGKTHRAGRVQRRRARPRASHGLRRSVKYEPRSRNTRRTRDFSVSTLFRGMQTRCQYCGHRCRRRYKGKRRRKNIWRRRPRKLDKIKIIKKRRHRLIKNKLNSVCIQAGSTSKMLSSLFMKTNNQLTDNVNYREDYNEISPEMICEALERLGRWKQSVNTNSILNYVRMNYPVSQDIAFLERDLREKLYIATVCGIVTDLKSDNWELTTPLQEQRLTETHVTLFWKLYADTMTPITPIKNVPEPDKTTEDAEIGLRFKM